MTHTTVPPGAGTSPETSSRSCRSAAPGATSRALALAVAIAALVALAAALAGIDARATYGARVTADEPQYLLTAQSLADDLDLDISDQIADRAYLPYHEITVDRQTSILDDGREISPHDPLLPALLALPMALGGWAAAKGTIAVVAALTAALTVWVAVRRWATSPRAAALVTCASFAGPPLAGYGTQVYPEMPAALAVLVGVASLTAPALRRRHAAVAAVSIVALPWLAVKYVPVAAVLAIALLVRLPAPRARAAVAAALGAAGALYLVAHRVWYGGWTVYATGDHFEQTGEFSVVGTRVDLLGRSRRLVGLLVDREFGMAAWSPMWLLLPFALAVLAVRRPPRWQLLTGLVAVGWLNATLVALTMHGWWVPGRQLVVILPVAVVAIAPLAQRRPVAWFVAVTGAVGAANWLWLAVESSTGRRTLVVDFSETAAPAYRVWRHLLPSGIADAATDRWLLAAWTVLLVVGVVAVVAATRLRRSGTPPSPASP